MPGYPVYAPTAPRWCVPHAQPVYAVACPPAPGLEPCDDAACDELAQRMHGSDPETAPRAAVLLGGVLGRGQPTGREARGTPPNEEPPAPRSSGV